MKMGDKYMPDAASADLVTVHLDLGAFAAINQKAIFIDEQHLGSRVPVVHR